MKELRRLVAICMLTASMYGMVLAGETQTPPAPVPPQAPECTMDGLNSPVTSPAPTSEVPTDLANDVVGWLVEAILY